MPKGVYDRSKSKAERSAEKSSKVATPKRKYTRKAAAGLPQVEKNPVAENVAGVGAAYSDSVYEARINLSSLTEAYSKVDDHRFRSMLVEKMTSLAERIEPKPIEKVAEVKVEKKAEKAAPEVEAPAAQAPAVPYPAPLPFNGANPQS